MGEILPEESRELYKFLSIKMIFRTKKQALIRSKIKRDLAVNRARNSRISMAYTTDDDAIVQNIFG